MAVAEDSSHARAGSAKKFYFTVQVSFFHMPTRESFGSTWQSQRGKDKRDEAVSSDAYLSYSVTLNDLVFWYTYIDDPRTLVIVELVATEVDPAFNITVASYGCGWTYLNPTPFGRRNIPAVDMNEDRDVLLKRSYHERSLFRGTPRDLFTKSKESGFAGLTHEAFLEKLESSSAFRDGRQPVLRYRVLQHHALLKARGLIAENEMVGGRDVVPGLARRSLEVQVHATEYTKNDADKDDEEQRRGGGKGRSNKIQMRKARRPPGHQSRRPRISRDARVRR